MEVSKPNTIEFVKEQDLQAIHRILLSWTAERVALVRQVFEAQPKAQVPFPDLPDRLITI